MLVSTTLATLASISVGIASVSVGTGAVEDVAEITDALFRYIKAWWI
jgi:hypothetical protein